MPSAKLPTVYLSHVALGEAELGDSVELECTIKSITKNDDGTASATLEIKNIDGESAAEDAAGASGPATLEDSLNEIQDKKHKSMMGEGMMDDGEME